MLRLDFITATDALSSDAQFAADWRVAQADRLSAERNGWWFETLHHPSFGSTIALVGHPDQVRSLLKNASWTEPVQGAGQAVAHIDWQWLEGQLSGFAADFGFSAAITRMVIALLMTGDVRKTAVATGVSYETAREYIEKARGIVGANNLQRLVTMMGMGLGRTGEHAEESDQFLAIAYGCPKDRCGSPA